jgi:transposase
MKNNGKKNTGKKVQKNQEQTMLRAEVILKVRCGLLTATEAARILGVSRKTYYQWERRGLSALVDALKQHPPGRPEEQIVDSEKDLLKKEVEQLLEEREQFQKRMDLKDTVHRFEVAGLKNHPTKKKKNGSGRSS